MEKPSLSPHLSAATLLGGALALCAFAANSLLARAALAEAAIDPLGFTSLRLFSGAVVLVLAWKLSSGKQAPLGGSWPGALYLIGYAGLFSWAYLSLTAASGALLLFGAVQGTMLVGSRLQKERPSAVQWFGFALAAGGLLWLLLPGAESPRPLPALAMLGAGVCWGLYSLRGVVGSNPLASTAGNFVRGTVLMLPLLVLSVRLLKPSVAGCSCRWSPAGSPPGWVTRSGTGSSRRLARSARQSDNSPSPRWQCWVERCCSRRRSPWSCSSPRCWSWLESRLACARSADRAPCLDAPPRGSPTQRGLSRWRGSTRVTSRMGGRDAAVDTAIVG